MKQSRICSQLNPLERCKKLLAEYMTGVSMYAVLNIIDMQRCKSNLQKRLIECFHVMPSALNRNEEINKNSVRACYSLPFKTDSHLVAAVSGSLEFPSRKGNRDQSSSDKPKFCFS